MTDKPNANEQPQGGGLWGAILGQMNAIFSEAEKGQAWREGRLPDEPLPEPPEWLKPKGVTPLVEGKEERPALGTAYCPKPTKRTYRTSYTLTELLAESFPEPDWLVEGLLPACGLVLLAGRPKRGKSTLARQLTVALGAGGVFVGRKLKQTKVLYICLEERPKSVQSKLLKLGATRCDNVRFEFAWEPLNQGGLQRLREYAQTERPAIIILDTLTRAFGGRIDWNDLGQTTALMDSLQTLAFDCGCLILAIDHLGKVARNSDSPDPINDLISSTGKAAVADDVLGLYRKRGGETALVGDGRNVGELELPLYFDRMTECYQVAEGPRPDSLEGRVLRYLKEHGKATTKELSEALDASPGSVNEILARLTVSGVVCRGQRQGHAVYYEVVEDSDGFTESSESSNLPNQRISESSRFGDSEHSANVTESLPSEVEQTMNTAPEPGVNDDLPGTCWFCGAEVWIYDGQGFPYCERCWGERHKDGTI